MRILRTIGIVGSATALLLSSTAAFANESATGSEQSVEVPTGTSRPTGAPATRAEVRKTEQERMQDVRKQAQVRVQTAREDTKALIESKREESKMLRETKREEAKTLMESKRVEAKIRVEANREKAEKRLTEIKDKAKQQMAERLAKQFEKQNSTWTDHFMKVLDRLDAISLKIQDRATTAAGNGKDISTATAAIAAAQTAIASARTAVIAQAAKTYVLDPSTIVPTTTTATTTPGGQEELMQGVRASFKNLHNLLFRDLFVLRDGPLTDARKAVQNALQALSKILGSGEGTATSTATSTNQ